MKRLIALIMVVAIVITAGCAYNKSTRVTVDGKGLKVPIKEIGTIEGDQVTATITRTVSITVPSKKTTLKSTMKDHDDSIVTE